MPFDYGGGCGDEEAAAGGQYAAVGFSYGGQGEEEREEEEQQQQAAAQQQQRQRQQHQQQPQEEEAEPFVAPFFVPERLRRHLPATQRQYKVRPLLLPSLPNGPISLSCPRLACPHALVKAWACTLPRRTDWLTRLAARLPACLPAGGAPDRAVCAGRRAPAGGAAAGAAAGGPRL